MSFINLVSVSGGKDSTVTLALALERREPETVRAVFADTGNEHELTLEHVDYLRTRFNIEIVTLRADFSEQIARKRRYILDKWPEKGVPSATCERAAALMVPTGIPFLDLCMWKGRFPSRMRQFCTEFLKTVPLTEHAIDLIDDGHTVISWQGVRRDESRNRSDAPMFDRVGGGLFIYRPIVTWSAADVFAYHAARGIESNPLYRMGMGRVGCMPCINCQKNEVMEIDRRFPEHIDRIEEWEAIVGSVTKRGHSSFFPAPDDGRGALRGDNIREYVEWAKTSRGGRQYDLEKMLPPPACSSSYGLCE